MKKLIAIMLAMFVLMMSVLLVACDGNKDPDTTPEHSSSSSNLSSSDPGQSAEPTPGSQETPGQSTDPDGSSDEPVQTPEPSTGSSDSGTTPGENTGYEKPAGYLDVDFGGHTFTFITTSDWADEVGRWCTEKEIAVESRTGGTVVDTAVYDRNQVMKNLYNCEIAAIEGNAGALIQNDVNTGTSTIDFGARQGAYWWANTNGTYVNIYDLDLDFNLPGWNTEFFAATSMRDSNGVVKNYAFDGDFNLSSFRATWGTHVNLDLYNQNFSENIFDIVDRGEWTIDKMMEMISAVAQDNGDSVWTVGDDTFGLLTTSQNAEALIISAGVRFVNVDENFNYTTGSEVILANNAVEALSKAGELYALDGVNVGGYTAAEQELRAGRTLFHGATIDVLERMSDDENLNVTIIPMPLYSSETQNEYKSYVNIKSSTYVVSRNACDGNMEMVSEFLNVFVFHSNKIVYPAFIQTYGSIYCQDERSADMIELLIEGRTYEYAYYRGSSSFGQVVGFVQDNKNQIARAATKIGNDLKKALDNDIKEMTNSK